MENTDELMKELKLISDNYEPLAMACSQIYFSMERLASIHFLYQFSIQDFLAILESVLAAQASPSTSSDNASERTQILKSALLSEVVRRVSKGLLQEDQVLFAVRLSQIYLTGKIFLKLD